MPYEVSFLALQAFVSVFYAHLFEKNVGGVNVVKNLKCSNLSLDLFVASCAVRK